MNATNTGGHGVHLIPRQPATDAFSLRLYGPGQIHSHDRRQWLPRMGRLPGADFSIQWIHTAGLDPDQYLPCLWHGPRDGDQA
ncbi:hypothetical protein D3C81_1126760 [compost metagenome]